MPLIQGITHRGIAGSDYTDCSFFFLYALCQVCVCDQKLLAISFA
jgi:hypothetical protein